MFATHPWCPGLLSPRYRNARSYHSTDREDDFARENISTGPPGGAQAAFLAIHVDRHPQHGGGELFEKWAGCGGGLWTTTTPATVNIFEMFKC